MSVSWAKHSHGARSTATPSCRLLAPASLSRHRSAVPPPSFLYRALLRAAVPVVPRLLREPNQRRADVARRAAPRDLAEWAGRHRDPTRPLAWFHAPSVGEGLQARAVLEALRLLRPELQLVYTHFSPSAEQFAASLAVDHAGYLPYDRGADVTKALDAVRPDLLVFTKLDLWPELATEAARRGAHVAMVAATVRPTSGRLRWPARALARPGYQALEAVAAIAREDGERLVTLGVPSVRIEVTGDPRVDSVLEVVAAASAEEPVTTLGDPSATLVAGSSWPEDEAILLEAFARVRRHHPEARLIVVPHEPTEAHLASVERTAARLALPIPVRLGSLQPGEPPAILLGDRVGVLARLYRHGAIAYVGGGWGEAGIHSVLEPAAWGLPVLIGPRDGGSRDVALLRTAGGLRSLPMAGAVEALAAVWHDWLAAPQEAHALGTRNRAALDGERGAAGRSAAMLNRLLR